MQKVKKQERQNILLEWIHCLSHAVAYLHRKRIAHSAICPSNVLIDENNKVAFSDLGFLETFQKDKKFDADELYNYGAPELFASNKKFDPDMLKPPIPTRKFFHKRRKSSTSNSGSDTSSETASALSVDSRGNYFFKTRSNSNDTITPITTRSSDQSAPPRLNTHDFAVSPVLHISFDQRSISSSKTTAPPPSINAEQAPPSYEPDRKAADIYSLACIFLDILSFLLKRKPNEFCKHRSTKLKNASGKGSHVDNSFHNNTPKVHTWMEILESDLPSTQDQALFALPPLFRLISEMLNPDPHRRPTAADVQDRVYEALYNYGGLQNLHCNNDDQRPASTMSFARSTSTSGSSSAARPSVSSSSGPRIAAFPPILSSLSLPHSHSHSLSSPPAVPPKSPKRRPVTPASSRPVTPRRAETSVGSANIPPIPPMPPGRGRSMMDVRRWGHGKGEGFDNGGVVGVSG
jgi:serine/threonine protein kinase